MPIDVLDKLSELAHSAVARLTVKSALNPLLWMCGTISTICFAAAYLFRDDAVLKTLLVLVGIVPIMLTCTVAGYFAFRTPEKLQSEEYQLRQQTLNIIEEKGGRITVDKVSLEEIANPPLPPVSPPKALPPAKDDP
jgi:hypothetical protein